MSQAILKSRVSEGSPNPCGATWDGLGVNFALFSAHATKVELACSTMPGSANWSDRTPGIQQRGLARLPADARPGTTYGYRVHGH